MVHGQYPQSNVEGRVIDESGNPVPLASIQLRSNYNKGTTNDINGNFKFSALYYRDTLVCTHVNYQTKKEAVVMGNSTLVFRLTRNPPALIELVISGDSRPIPITLPVKPIVKDSLREEDPDIIFSKVEIPAAFYKADLRRYLERNIRIPDSTSVRFDATGEFEGMMTVQFTVDKNGKAGNARIIKSVDKSLDKVAIEVINNMPVWAPAIQNGRNIDSEQEISIRVFINLKSIKQ
jgi:TonB family protein